MSWRNVVIGSPAYLSLDQCSLKIERPKQEAITVPLEDIASIVLDHWQITITSPLLSALCQRGVALVSCDSAHTPCGVQLPFHQHSRTMRAFQLQLGVSAPFLKNCWKRIIQQKIRNQARCLELVRLPQKSTLRGMATCVKSGDSDNRESAAAVQYFAALFPGLKRREDSIINAALNYGYSILRSCVARCLTAYGFQPALGIHHCNELNSFNLADDFLEPFRPVVDLWTFLHIRESRSFDKEHRVALVRLLSCLVKVDKEEVTLQRACDVLCASYVTACREKAPEALQLPELMELQTRHE